MNGVEKPFRKKSDPKNRKNSKNQSEIAACEQKTTTDKANFCSNTVFSLYFKIRAKKFHAAKPLAFSLHFLFRRDQNHYSNLTSKIMNMCEQTLKKNIAGQVLTYNSKNFHWLNRKSRPRMGYEWIQKTTLKKSEQKKLEKNRKSISKCRMWAKKTLARNEILIQTKN